MSADKDRILPSATPGIHLSISLWSETALKAIVTSDVLVHLHSDIYEKALPYQYSPEAEIP